MRIAPLFFFGVLLLSGLMAFRGVRADAAFQAWLQALWPQAQALGVSRATFDLATNGLEPDLSLPDLVLPGPDCRPSWRLSGRVYFSSPSCNAAPSAYIELLEGR